MTSAWTFQLDRQDGFERTVTKSTIAGAVAAAVGVPACTALLAAGLGAGTTAVARAGAVGASNLFIPILVAAAVGVATARGDVLDRWLIGGLSLLFAGAIASLAGGSGWAPSLAAAATGALMVRSELCDLGEAGWVGRARPSAFHYLICAALAAGLAKIAGEICEQLGHVIGLGTVPGWILEGGIQGMFLGLSSIGCHLHLAADPVESAYLAAGGRLTGEPKVLVARAVQLYRECGKGLALLPPLAEREEMATTLQRMVQGTIEQARDWCAIEADLLGGASEDARQKLSELEARIATVGDSLARSRLTSAASSLRDELDRIGELGLQRERALSKLLAETALLERARLSLIGFRCSQTELKGAELSSLAQRLDALSSMRSAEGRSIHLAAEHAELAHHEVGEILRQAGG